MIKKLLKYIRNCRARARLQKKIDRMSSRDISDHLQRLGFSPVRTRFSEIFTLHDGTKVELTPTKLTVWRP